MSPSADRPAAPLDPHRDERPQDPDGVQVLSARAAVAADTLERRLSSAGPDQRVVGGIGHLAVLVEQRGADEAADDDVLEDRVEALWRSRETGRAKAEPWRWRRSAASAICCVCATARCSARSLDVSLEDPQHRDRNDEERDAGVDGEAQRKPGRLVATAKSGQSEHVSAIHGSPPYRVGGET